ncbi:EAL domain-containing protein [Nitrosophilus alvini]|uniref:sensor domain-containing protein n=1 Tax=Nitrosophilus alvini TaxID=2714855 RepID=UPI00190B3C70|nr:EAL domain-containing protein [Nitrosophilus alvini]
MNRHSIFFKLSFIIILMSSIYIIYLNVSNIKIAQKNFINAEQDKIEQILKSHSTSLAMNVSLGFWDGAREILKKMQELNGNILSFSILDRFEKEMIRISSNEGVKSDNENLDGFSKRIKLTDPLTNKHLGYLEIVYSNKHYKEMINDYYKFIAVSILFFVLIVVLILSILAKLLKPLKSLARKLEQFDPENPKNVFTEIEGSDEIVIINNASKHLVDKIINYTKRLKQLNETLQRSRKHLLNAQRIAHIGSWEYDIKSKNIYWSEELFNITGLKIGKKRVTVKEMLGYIDISSRKTFVKALKNAITKGEYFDIVCKIKVGDKIKYLNIHGKREYDRKPLLIGTALDITAQIKAEETIRFQAFHDALTGLPNRFLLKDHLNLAISMAKRHGYRLAVLFMDLDHFKLINDTLGHEIGDKFLKSVSSELLKCIRDGDTLARVGGDEFILLLPEIDKIDDAVNVAEKIIETINRKWIIENKEFYTSASIGISIFPDDSVSADELIKNADTAMYHAKEQGRNNYQLYTSELNKKIREQLRLESDLHQALSNNEFVLYYQPQISLATGEVTGAEVLLRWKHPVLGIISPGKFIKLAENTGTIIKIGEWILHEACRQNIEWQKKGLTKIKVSVNLSGRQFQHANLAKTIEKVLEQTKIEPCCLDLEITENISMKYETKSIEIIKKLKKMGVSISIDDFGTGYSSLSILKQFPIDTIKVDRSFVKDTPNDLDDAMLVQTIIAMGHGLGFKVVAEGVETAAQLEFLKKYGCDIAQGNYIGEPMCAKDFEEFLKESEKSSKITLFRVYS